MKASIKKLFRSLSAFWLQEDGQDLVEYSLLIALVALAAIGLVGGTRIEAKGILSTMNVALTGATAAAS